MSEYLGWTERKPAAGRGSFDRDVIPGGPHTHSYESYVRNIFHPMNRLKNKDKDQLARDHGLSASAMLRMERSLGKAVIDETYDRKHYFDKMPLETLYQELGLKNPQPSAYRNFQVYEPKQSSEYFAASYEAERERHKRNMAVEAAADRERDNSTEDDDWMPPSMRTPIHVAPTSHHQHYSSYQEPLSSYRSRADDEYLKNNRKTLIDYKDFNSSPLSPYLYQSHPYVRQQDSRIVGSNFVQLTSRPKDAFLDKIDATLQMVRDMPRY